MSIYENIDRLLSERHISRRKLASMAGIKPTTLASCFSRRSEHFPSKYAVPIAKALGVNVNDLYGVQPVGMAIEDVLNAVKQWDGQSTDELSQSLNAIEQDSLDKWLMVKQSLKVYAGIDIADALKPMIDEYIKTVKGAEFKRVFPPDENS